MIYVNKDSVLKNKLEDLLNWCKENDIKVQRVDDRFSYAEVTFYFDDLRIPSYGISRVQYDYQDVVTNPDYIKEKLKEYFGR